MIQRKKKNAKNICKFVNFVNVIDVNERINFYLS